MTTPQTFEFQPMFNRKTPITMMENYSSLQNNYIEIFYLILMIILLTRLEKHQILPCILFYLILFYILKPTEGYKRPIFKMERTRPDGRDL